MSPDDFEYRRLSGEIDKLVRADPYEGWVMHGTAATLVGDAVELRRAFAAASNIAGKGWDHCGANKAQALMSLGFFSEARQQFLEVVSAEAGNLGAFVGLGLGVGAISAVHGMLDQARKMNLQHGADIDLDTVDAAAAIMREAHMTDEQVTAMQDLAGEVLRRHRVRMDRYGVGVVDLEGLPVILYKIMVQREPAEIADMSFELAELVAGMSNIPDRLHISFSRIE
jgi:hypothetical protein